MNREYLETIKIIDGKACHLLYHQIRLDETLGKKNYYLLKELIKPPKRGLYRCRIMYDMIGIEIEYVLYEKRSIESLKIVKTKGFEYSKKYLDRTALNTLVEEKKSCDDILIVNNEKISDTSIANIAFFDGKKWVTPKEPLLHGTTRARYLAEGKIIQEDIKISDLRNYTKVALMNAMIDFDIIAKENIEDIIC